MDTNLLAKKIPFRKMHGLENDFVVLDSRQKEITLSTNEIIAIADRKTGVGFDQLLIIQPPKKSNGVFMSVYNSDGNRVETCGNGARCIAKVVMNDLNTNEIIIETLAGPIKASKHQGGQITVNLGKIKYSWKDIPMSRKLDTLNLDFGIKDLPHGIAVNVGNPHVVFFVKDVENLDLTEVGPKISSDKIFPDGANVEFAQLLSKDHIRMRVWERGVGVTKACGTGACATLVASAKKGLSKNYARVSLDGGDLFVELSKNDEVKMTGPAEYSFTGLTG